MNKFLILTHAFDFLLQTWMLIPPRGKSGIISFFKEEDFIKKSLTEVKESQSSQNLMAVEVNVKKGEPVERALRRLKKRLDREGVIRDVRAKRYFEKPSVTKRRNMKNAVFNNMVRLKYDN
jgi:small subunit ribosomal protein S21